jgi:hypothetical protein
MEMLRNITEDLEIVATKCRWVYAIHQILDSFIKACTRERSVLIPQRSFSKFSYSLKHVVVEM